MNCPAIKTLDVDVLSCDLEQGHMSPHADKIFGVEWNDLSELVPALLVTVFYV